MIKHIYVVEEKSWENKDMWYTLETFFTRDQARQQVKINKIWDDESKFRIVKFERKELVR